MQLFSTQDKSVPSTKTLETPINEPSSGSTFAGRYEVIEELGKGGMGKVYRVLDKKLTEEVVLKLIKPEIGLDKKTIERFSNELKLSRKIVHKNVARMFDLNEEKGEHYITMEYVRGEDLRRLIRKMGVLSPGQAISIARQVCEGLGEAHRLGVIHRDLKPQNVMIDEDGNAKILDFGIARSLAAKGITGAGVMIGTPEYMSPEQVEGKETDQRSDIYSLGVILYEMLTGALPFEGKTPFAIGIKQKSENPEEPKKLNPLIPDDLNQLILKCMEKKKENRYQTAGEVRSELIRIEKRIPTAKRELSKRQPFTLKEITVSFSLGKLIIPGLIVIVICAVFFSLIGKKPPKKLPLTTRLQLTFTGNVFWPAVSPDGQFLAYVKRETFDEDKLVIQDLASGQTLDVLSAKSCSHICWTPDGSELAFWAAMQDSTSGIYLIPRFGGTQRRLDAAEFLAWSPDGSKFATCSADSKEIRIIDKTTGKSTFISLSSSLLPPADIDWSPNGKFLLLLAWYESHRFGIWTLSIDGSEEHKVIVEDTDIDSARWAPGGDAIYYIKFMQPSETQLWKVPVSKETGIPTQAPSYLTGGLESKTDCFAITRDGKRLFYPRYHDHANLWLATVEDQGKNQIVITKQLTTGTLFNLCPGISPDGRQIAFSRGRGKPFNIFVMPIEGDSPRQITFFNSFNFFPAWAPDSKELAFSSNQGGINTLWKVSVFGGSPQQFVESTLGDVHTCLTWSPMQNIMYPNKEASNFHVLIRILKKSNFFLKATRLYGNQVPCLPLMERKLPCVPSEAQLHLASG